MTFTLTASAGRAYNWFIKSAADGKQPVVFDNNKMPDKYGALYLGSPDEKVVYLTFDVGYVNENVIKILDVMEKYNIKSAFFLLPQPIKHDTDVVKRMYDEGHIVANHSYSHRNMATVTDYSNFLKEITDLEDLYREYTGHEMGKYFRPPEGRFSEKTLEFSERAGRVMVFWSFAYKDWDNGQQPNTAGALNKILSNLHNGEVFLLHPTSATNAAVFEDAINEILARGYRFGTLDELYAAQYPDVSNTEIFE